MRRSNSFELVLLAFALALYWLFQNIFGNLFYAYVKQLVETHIGIMEADVIAGFSLVLPSLLAAVATVWGLYRYIYRQLSKERDAEKQAVIDGLAEEINWATIHLLNRPDGWATQEAAKQLAGDILIWMQKVEARLGDREHFTVAMQHHFGTSGFIQPVNMTGIRELDHQFSILRNKFERLRDIIGWLQARL